jgi:UDP-2,3-diacylglucosamine hydrolase
LSDVVEKILWIKIGQLQRLVDFFTTHGVQDLVMAGGITKQNMYTHFAPDERALNLVARLTKLSDDHFLRALADDLETDRLFVRPSTLFAPDLPTPEGILTSRTPTDEEMADVRFGWRIAKELGRLDVGQCVVVRQLAALALEGIDGTDETIRRGGRLGGEKAVVVKVVKPDQDLRFDLPAVGLETIEIMAGVKASVLAVEAHRTLMFDREKTITAADKAGISIVSIKENADD